MKTKITDQYFSDNRITLNRFEVIPENSTIHNVNLKVIFGKIAIKLNDLNESIHYSGNELTIPNKTKVIIVNLFDTESEIMLSKA